MRVSAVLLSGSRGTEAVAVNNCSGERILGALPFGRRFAVVKRCSIPSGFPMAMGLCMSIGKEEAGVDILLRDAVHPCRLHGPCIVRVTSRPETRVVDCGSQVVRVAFTQAEIRVLAGAMNRAYPRFGAVVPTMRDDCNRGYVPGDDGRPFLVALGVRGSAVKIGMEIASALSHPVVELHAVPKSNVRRTGASITWMPSWTEFRVLCAHFEQTALQSQSATETSGTSARARPAPRSTGWNPSRRAQQ